MNFFKVDKKKVINLDWISDISFLLSNEVKIISFKYGDGSCYDAEYSDINEFNAAKKKILLKIGV